MPKPFVFFLLVPFCGAVFGQAIEPGEWEFNTVTASPLFPRGQASTFRRCITREDAENPERWMARQSETGQCKLTPVERSADAMKWSVACPKTNMRGTGVARRIAPGRIESEIALASEFQGYRIEMNTRAYGRRLGPCKS